MEKRIPTLKKSFFSLAAIALLAMGLVCPQEFSEKKIRLYIWALQDAYPGVTENSPHEYAKKHLQNLSEFLLGGMTYGWRFTYTPSDKLRKVDEYFECTPLKSFDNDRKNIEYEKTYWREDKIFCWVNFERTPQMLYYYKQFSNIKNPRVIGKGKGKLSRGFEGLEEAAQNAIKDGVREYYRKVIKNKPKEISGTVLIRKVPAILIDSGNYVVELDFFLETSKIKEYSQF
ncbi:hypothetical protein [Treponema sp.]|uniref:hypothetical protein n=1 Tax=Treponema sp. TaxID=166 RepID=UPI00298E59C4|nr:hypothetical protein [Treponema sp.]MCR5613961.1 hypothetical protein [Treponema sp.]